MVREVIAAAVDAEVLRGQISDKYSQVAKEPEAGFHFHTGRPLTRMLDYDEGELARVPEKGLSRSRGPETPSRWDVWLRVSASSISAAELVSTVSLPLSKSGRRAKSSAST